MTLSNPSAFDEALLAAAALPVQPALWLSVEMHVLAANAAAQRVLGGADVLDDEPVLPRFCDCVEEPARRDFLVFWEEWADKPTMTSLMLTLRGAGIRQVDFLPWGENILVLLREPGDTQAAPVLNSQLIQSQKMETIGRLAGGLAHSFNNTLMGVIGYCELAMMDVEDGHPVRFHLETIKEIGEKASKLSRQLLAYSRKQQLQLAALPLGDLISDMEPMLHHWLGKKAWLKTVQEDRWPVWGDRGQLEQVVMNLVFNARDAMPEGGKLSLCTRDILVDTDLAQAFPGLRPGSYGLLQVLDTGFGMNAETLANIFEPFYTTKSHGKGTGLGLATVYGVIKQHRGYIGVASEVGRGSSFTLLVPHADAPERAGSPATTSLSGRHYLVLSEERRWAHYTAAVLRAQGGDVYVGWTGLQRWRRGVKAGESPAALLIDESMLAAGRERLRAAGLDTERLPSLVFSGLGSQTPLAIPAVTARLPKLIAAGELLAALSRCQPLGK
ncbi:MAG: hypothetical protein HYV16_09695 [Gammaproteobacteria bacterium]|nr:hypothetical protein [Gammaproteobacteria bacterium]